MLNLFQHPFRRRLGDVIEKQPCVYILAGKPYGTLYVGVTSDLVARMVQHRANGITGFTSRYSVHMLVRYEMFGDMEVT